MKKVLCFFVLSVMFFTVGCTANQSATKDVFEESTVAEGDKKAEEPSIQVISAGDVITGTNCEITIKSVNLSYDVLPDDTSGFYTHYPASPGKVLVDVDVDVKNTAKQNLSCDEIMKVTADYNDGYTYTGYAIVDDSTAGFTYANISQVDPLETKGMRYLIDCPEEVEQTTNPLFLIFTLDQKDYKFVIR
ncbi:hypothetical protein [Anaerotignum propionicum]|uniref:hypothetical protein n=1 Tax=Anaerotignum propionicum TaxID=28446 RepID=UPI00210DD845|nr:hypothetical protein [Anaerotignum propionicum]MCQ4935034.1 hypothetical protein [Anaerotignum propionicum]